jgi:6-phosphogluconolactonase
MIARPMMESMTKLVNIVNQAPPALPVRNPDSHMNAPRKFVTCADADAVASAVADIVVDISRETAKPAAAIALSGGSTPQRLYRLLASEAYRDRINWKRLHWFCGDERFVPADHPDSNMRMAREAMLDHVDTPRENIHPVPTDAPSVFDAASLYEKDLQAFYGATTFQAGRPLFDLVLLGLGEDGHTASLFPGKPAVNERGRWVAPVPEAGLAPFVSRVTLTFPAIGSSRHAAFLVTGGGKRDMVQRIQNGADVPAARVDSTGDLVWYLDKAAAGV